MRHHHQGRQLCPGTIYLSTVDLYYHTLTSKQVHGLKIYNVWSFTRYEGQSLLDTYANHDEAYRRMDAEAEAYMEKQLRDFKQVLTITKRGDSITYTDSHDMEDEQSYSIEEAELIGDQRDAIMQRLEDELKATESSIRDSPTVGNPSNILLYRRLLLRYVKDGKTD